MENPFFKNLKWIFSAVFILYSLLLGNLESVWANPKIENISFFESKQNGPDMLIRNITPNMGPPPNGQINHELTETFIPKTASKIIFKFSEPVDPDGFFARDIRPSSTTFETEWRDQKISTKHDCRKTKSCDQFNVQIFDFSDNEMLRENTSYTLSIQLIRNFDSDPEKNDLINPTSICFSTGNKLRCHHPVPCQSFDVTDATVPKLDDFPFPPGGFFSKDSVWRTPIRYPGQTIIEEGITVPRLLDIAQEDPEDWKSMSNSIERNIVENSGIDFSLLENVVPVYYAEKDTPLVNVFIQEPKQNHKFTVVNGPPSNNPFGPVTVKIPIPNGAISDCGFDRFMVIYNPHEEHPSFYEMIGVRFTNNQWVAETGNKIDAFGDGVLRGNGKLSSEGVRASGSSMVAGLVWPQELKAGKIEHALAVGYEFIRKLCLIKVNDKAEFCPLNPADPIPNGKPLAPFAATDGQYDPPRFKKDGSGNNIPLQRSQIFNGVPMGARLVVPSNTTIPPGLPPYERIILEALKKYGMIIVDTATGGLSIGAVNVYSFKGNPYKGILPACLKLDNTLEFDPSLCPSPPDDPAEKDTVQFRIEKEKGLPLFDPFCEPGAFIPNAGICPPEGRDGLVLRAKGLRRFRVMDEFQPLKVEIKILAPGQEPGVGGTINAIVSHETVMSGPLEKECPGIAFGFFCKLYKMGSKVTLTAIPTQIGEPPGFPLSRTYFTGWDPPQSCKEIFPNINCTLTMGGAKRLTATFSTSRPVDPVDFNDSIYGGTSFGTILNPGDQFLNISDSPYPAGVVVNAASNGGQVPASIRVCDEAEIRNLNAGDTIIVTCGSVKIRVISGDITVEFPQGEIPALVDLNEGNTLSFDGSTETFTVPISNKDSVVIQKADAELILEPGESRRFPILLTAIKDSYLDALAKNNNKGGHTRLRVNRLGKNRSLVAFNLSEVSLRGLTKATLALTIKNTPYFWGSSGQSVSVHPPVKGLDRGNRTARVSTWKGARSDVELCH